MKHPPETQTQTSFASLTGVHSESHIFQRAFLSSLEAGLRTNSHTRRKGTTMRASAEDHRGRVPRKPPDKQ
jgi:hypothetical protein